MARSRESFNKKDVRTRKEKKRKEKEKKRLERKDQEKAGGLDDMIAFVDEFGMITSTSPDPSKKVSVKLEDIQVSVPKKESLEEEDPIHKGTVNFFDSSRGFGFIKDLSTKRDLFVHANDLLEEIKEGNLVSFEIQMGNRGPVAVRVKRADG